MKTGIELNGVANLKIILDDFTQHSSSLQQHQEHLELVNKANDQLDLLERYMIAYCKAVNTGVQPPYWHEIRENPKLFPTNREANSP